MNARNELSQSIQLHSNLIGRKYIKDTFRNESDPAKAIFLIHEHCGVDFPAMFVLPFLDLLKIPRYSVYQYLFENSKNKLEG
jgi:hypothetical protein